MQKKVIALAVAGLVSGAAFAQSNVTIYGVMDAYAGVANADNAGGNQKQTVVNSGGLSSSRLGFMGEEALGNGLKAIFKLELGSMDITAATNNIGNTRQAFVGLSSDKVGTIRLGRAQTLGYDYAIKYDALAASNAFSPLSSIGRAVGGNGILLTAGGSLGRQANAVSYISPSFGGVTIRGDVAAGEQVTGTDGASGYQSAQKYYALGGDYDNGPLSAGLAYAEIKDLNGTVNGTSAAGIKDWAIAGKYDFKIVQPFLLYQESKYTPTAGSEVKSKIWSAGLAIPVGAAGVIKAAYVDFKNDATAQAKAKGWAIDYEHSLSKRTTAYIGYQGINNGSNAAFGVGNVSTAINPSADKNVSFYGVGLRHTF